VFAALGDKDVAGIVKPLGERIARWHVAGLVAESPRGRDAATTVAAIRAALPAADVIEHADVASALAAARVRDDGRLVLVFGSFLTVAAAMRAFSADGR
jgi:dihydrofolate synthase/folylpolyglutamate synthase